MDDEGKLLMILCTGVIAGLLGMLYNEIVDYSGGFLSSIPWGYLCMVVVVLSVLGIAAIGLTVLLRVIDSKGHGPEDP